MLWKKSKNTPRSSFSAVFLFLLSFIFSLSSFCTSSVSAVDAVLPVRGFAHDVEIRSGCTAYTDVAQIDSSECSFWSTNLGWRRFDLKDVNVTNGWYYQFYLNVYVESLTEPGTTPLIQTDTIQSINNSFDVVSYNQVAANTYQGGFVNSTAKAGYSYTYSVIVRANETALNASIRLGSANSVDIFQHLSAGTGEYVTANFQISRLHAFEPIDYGSQLDEIVAAIEQLSQSSDTSAVVSKLNEIKTEQQATTDAIEDNTSAVEEQTDAINDFKDYVEDDTPPELNEDSTDALADSAGWLPAGPVDSILTLPITFMQQIVNVLTGSDNCSPVYVPLPAFMNSNQNIILPCMRPIINQMGFLAIYEVVGGVVAMFIIWDTLKWLYEFVDKTLTFREDNSSIWGGL